MKVLYVIHTSPKRIDFVRDYMIPCFKRYGIDDIIVWNDEDMKGQLNAWTECAWWIIKERSEYMGTWHLEDDVIPCRDFKKIAENEAQKGIVVQGFITNCRFTGFKGNTGLVSIDYLPYGMQCIYIPNFYLKGFIYFVDEYVRTGRYKKRQYDCGRLYSDNVFRGFLKKYCENAMVNILDECMVEHVDYLIGGRSVKGKKTDRTAIRFDNHEEIERFKLWLKEASNGATTNRN